MPQFGGEQLICPQGQSFAKWRVPHASKDMFLLELKTILLALSRLVLDVSSCTCFFYMDNNACKYVLMKGLCRHPVGNMMLRKIWRLLLLGNLNLVPFWVPSALNPSDALSRVFQPNNAGEGFTWHPDARFVATDSLFSMSNLPCGQLPFSHAPLSRLKEGQG